MKQRSIMTVICLSIITLGIYDLFWLASTKKELNTRAKEHIPTLWLLFSPALFAVVISIVVGIIGAASNASDSSMHALGVFVGFFVGLAGFVVVPVYWFLKYSKAVNEYTNGEMSTAVAFILLWMLRFVGIAVIQDKFNDMLARGGVPASPAGQAGAMSGWTAPNNMPQQMPPAPVQPQQPPVDPTQPQSYEHQPPTPPAAPLVQ